MDNQQQHQQVEVVQACTDHDEQQQLQLQQLEQEQLQQKSFLHSLVDARELSIKLLTQRDPQNFMQGVYRLEMTTISCSASTQSKQSNTNHLVMEKKGIRDPSSIWPLYTFSVDEQQSSFLLESFLSALADVVAAKNAAFSSSSARLESLVLQGLGRIPGFYTKLLHIFNRAATSTSSSTARALLSSVSIIGWSDFCENVNNRHILSDAFSKLTRFSVDHLKGDDVESSQKLSLSLAQMTRLQSLQLQTGHVGSSSDHRFWPMMQHAFSEMTQLKELSWHTTTNVARLPYYVASDDDNDTIQRLFRTIGSQQTLKKLELCWAGGLHASLLHGLLLGNTSSCPNKSTTTHTTTNQHQLETLMINSVNTGSAHVIGQYLLETNTTSLKSLHLSFDDSSNATRVMEGITRHTNLQNVTLSNLHMDNDVAKTIQMMFVYNEVLTDFTMSTSTKGIAESGCLQDMLLGLAKNNTLTSVILQIQNDCVLRYYTSLTLQDMLVQNTALRHLHLGKCQIPPDGDCAKVIGQGIVCNKTLLSLCCAPQLSPSSSLVEALQQNKTLVEFSPLSPSMDFYLQLNRLGRQHILDPHFSSALLPLVLQKAAPQHIQYLLQARAEIFNQR